MKLTILILSIFILASCKPEPTKQPSSHLPRDMKQDVNTGALKGKEKTTGKVVKQNIPNSVIPFGHSLPKNWSKCAKYWKPIAQATYKYGDKNDKPQMYLSQSKQESQCNPKVSSHVGAQGFMQIMPTTQKYIERRWKKEFDAWDAGENIQAGIWLNQVMRKYWKPEYRSWCDRVMLMFSSYNSGAGWWQRAQKKCKKEGKDSCNSYYEMAEWFPLVNTRGAHENLNYVKKITILWNKIQENGGCPLYDATHFLDK